MNYLNITDLTNPLNGLHAINIALDRIQSSMERWAGLGADVIRRSPVVDPRDNYDALYYEGDAISRSTRYTHYLDDGKILRTQTTAMIPQAIRETDNDRLILAPGLVYRRDVMDKTHVGAPHQVDIWLLRRARMGRKQLLEMICVVMDELLPGMKYRCNETIHPYTVNGLEVEVLMGDRWIEVLECGEAHPWLLHDNGKSIGEWSGLAMGIGLDRLIMLLKGLDDIRLLRSPNPRIAKQMRNLEPYSPVSKHNASKRDLSLCVDDPDMEVIGGRIREIEGSDVIEDISLVAGYPYAEVPEVARERLGMRDGQHNLLIRIVVRSLEGDLPRETANDLYTAIYEHVHEGNAGYRIK